MVVLGGGAVSYERGILVHSVLTEFQGWRDHTRVFPRVSLTLNSEDSAHVGAVGLTLEPLAW